MRNATSLIAAVAAAFGATACCFGPLLLITLGFSGATAARLEGLAPAQPLFVAFTLLFVGVAFHALYIRPRKCAPDDVCANPAVLRRQRVTFWFVVALIAAMALFPTFSELFWIDR